MAQLISSKKMNQSIRSVWPFYFSECRKNWQKHSEYRKTMYFWLEKTRQSHKTPGDYWTFCGKFQHSMENFQVYVLPYKCIKYILCIFSSVFISYHHVQIQMFITLCYLFLCECATKLHNSVPTHSTGSSVKQRQIKGTILSAQTQQSRISQPCAKTSHLQMYMLSWTVKYINQCSAKCQGSINK